MMVERTGTWIVGLALLAGSSPVWAAACAPEDDNARQCFVKMAVATEPSPDGQLRLMEPLVFVDDQGKQWTAPTSTLTDGASIPDMFVPIIGDRLDRRYFDAAVVHDAYSALSNTNLPQYHSDKWENVHHMFYEAMLGNGTPRLKAKIMYAAVYLGGPRWDDLKRSLSDVSEEVLQQELEWCIRWVEAKDPTPERIAEWMTAREPGVQANQMNEPDWDVLLK